MKELALHILDIIHNSIRAEAKLIQLYVNEDKNKDILTITIIDDGHGMDSDLLKNVTDPFTTTRTTRRVGLGLPLLKQAAMECNGNLEIRSTKGEGTKVSIWFQHSHIDRVPLGNMVETITTLLLTGNDFDLQYEHQVNDSRITFDTRTIRDILGEVPLSHPDVIEWISQTLQEEMKQLY